MKELGPGIEALCRLIARGEETQKLCEKIVADIATTGYSNISTLPPRQRSLATQWLRAEQQSVGLILVLRIPYCRGTGARWRRPLVAATVNPADPATSPGFLAAATAARLRPWSGWCTRREDATDEPPQDPGLELLCRILGAGKRSRDAMKRCTRILADIARQGYTLPPPDDPQTRRILAYLHARGILERHTTTDCDNPDRKHTAYTMSHKTWPKLQQTLMRLTIIPPQCTPHTEMKHRQT